ncbi:MAG: hypothetical protein JWO05_2733 [Gemmatimonadetes bacterium]|nr:hypothetical protein [Gemmatimonadota bacterium]
MMSIRRSTLAATGMLCVALLAACGDSGGLSPTTTTTTTTPPDVTPATVVSTLSGTLSGTAGGPITTPLTVSVANKNGVAVANAPVTFAVTAGGGQVGSASVNTNAQGQASTSWTLGSAAGTQTVTATVAGLPVVTFTALATAAPATTLVKVSGDAQVAAAGTAAPLVPTVKVTDAFGNPVSGVLVSFTLPAGSGSVSTTVANTGTDGIARAGTWTLGTHTGVNQLSVSATGVANVTFTATGVPGAPAVLQLTPAAAGFSLSSGGSQQLGTAVLDAFGNTVSNATPTFTSSNAGVASVSSSGLVQAVAAGSTTITVSVGTLSTTRTVDVLGHPTGFVQPPVTLPGPAFGVAYAGGDAFVSIQGSAIVVRTSLDGLTQLNIPTGNGPTDVMVTPDGSKVIVGNIFDGSLSIITVASNAVLTVTPAPASSLVRVVLNNAGTRAYMMMANDQVYEVDIASGTLVRTIGGSGLAPTAARVTAGDTLMWVAYTGKVLLLNIATGQVRKTILFTGTAADLEVSRDGNYLYLANATSGQLDLLEVAGLRVLGQVTVDAPVYRLALTPDMLELWASQPAGGHVTAINVTSSSSPIPTRFVGTQGAPRGIAFDRSGTLGFIANSAGRLDIVR